MGSSSVYCGISKITITEDEECYFLPLRNMYAGKGDMYGSMFLPIEGKYDGYQGLAEIKTNPYVERFSRKHNLDAKEGFGYQDLGGFGYMWINKEVFDFLSSYRFEGFRGVNNFYLGDDDLLNALGFKRKARSDIERFNQPYEKDGIILNSDGKWLKERIYNILEFKNRFGIDISKFENKYECELYPLWSTLKRRKKLGYIVGAKEVFFAEETEYENKTDALVKTSDFGSDYFCKKCCELIILSGNICPASTEFKPYTNAIAPQDGEFERHQVLLDKFAEINRSKIITQFVD